MRLLGPADSNHPILSGWMPLAVSTRLPLSSVKVTDWLSAAPETLAMNEVELIGAFGTMLVMAARKVGKS